jgi:hypothetical protein
MSWLEIYEKKWKDEAEARGIQLPARFTSWDIEYGCTFTYINELKTYIENHGNEKKDNTNHGNEKKDNTCET